VIETEIGRFGNEAETTGGNELYVYLVVFQEARLGQDLDPLILGPGLEAMKRILIIPSIEERE